MEETNARSLAKRMVMVPESTRLHLVMTVWQAALNMGVSKLVFPLYRNIIALFALAPFPFFLEKKDRPLLTTKFLVKFFLLGCVGITCNQGLYLLGLDNTSPTFAPAIENIVPAVTFLMAVVLRIEQVHLNRKDGIAKVVGTLASVAGASGKNWTLGCIYLIVHCLCWSGWAPVFQKYPARLSVTSYSCFFSTLQFLVIAASYERDLQAWQVHSDGELCSIFYVGLVTSALSFAVQTWVIDRAGLVFVLVYLPVQTLLVVF
ncbi:hypothetical protein ACJW30_02G130800 [Castanea mollissima]